MKNGDTSADCAQAVYSRSGGLRSRREFLREFALGAACVMTVPFLGGRTALAAETGGNKVLIVYFSHSGNTRRLAELIHEQTGGRLAELRVARPYPQDYDAVVDMAKKELRANARPALAPEIPELGDARTLFIGYPNWWGTFPMAVFTFLETHNPGDRTVIPFCTHEGSRFGRSERDLRRLCPQARILKGFEVRGSRVGQAREDVAQWLREIDMIKGGQNL